MAFVQQNRAIVTRNLGNMGKMGHRGNKNLIRLYLIACGAIEFELLRWMNETLQRCPACLGCFLVTFRLIGDFHYIFYVMSRCGALSQMSFFANFAQIDATNTTTTYCLRDETKPFNLTLFEIQKNHLPRFLHNTDCIIDRPNSEFPVDLFHPAIGALEQNSLALVLHHQ